MVDMICFMPPSGPHQLDSFQIQTWFNKWSWFLACLLAWMFVCKLAYLFACFLVCLLACLLAHLFSVVFSFWFVFLPF